MPSVQETALLSIPGMYATISTPRANLIMDLVLQFEPLDPGASMTILPLQPFSFPGQPRIILDTLLT